MATNAIRHNPYIAGNALRHQRGFVGRSDVLQLVSGLLSAQNQSALVLFGQRRIGKTSILLQLHRRLATPLFLPVYFDLMDRARRPLGLVLYELAATIAADAKLPAPERAPFDDAGVYFRRTFLPQLYAALGESRHPVLLFDEFDVLDAVAEERLPETAAAHAFFPYLRELLQGEPRLRFIFVVGRRAEDLSINVKATFKAALYKRVSVLDPESARRLITVAERDGTLTFAPEAVERILSLTAGHPFFIQLICQLLWDAAHAGANGAPPHITLPMVERRAARAIEAGQNVFEWIWDGLPPAERVIFSAIAAATEEGTLVSEEQLTRLLQSHGVRILSRDLELAPETLVEWEMLRRAEGDARAYRFFSELMRRWVKAAKPLPKVKDELDRIVPLAETLFRSAEGYYRQRDLPNAEAQLRQALNVNQNHLKARLLVAQVILEQGRIDAAILELEEAHRIDEAAGRLRLVEALLLRAGEHERAGADEDALRSYERALEVSPHEAKARDGLRAIWRRRAEAALRADDLEATALAYKQAGDETRAAETAALAKRRQIAWLRNQAADAEAREAWAEAAESYAKLAVLAPAAAEWPAAAARARQAQQAQDAFRRGETALVARDFATAIGAAEDALRVRPDHRAAAELRNRALDTLAREARQHEQREEWAAALDLYRPVAEKIPGDDRIKREMTRLQMDRDIAERYAAGAVALRQRRWEDAARDLAAVTKARPSYKDAAKLLERAERGRQGKRVSIPRWTIGLVAMVLLIAGGVTYYYFPTWFPSTAEQYYNRGVARKGVANYDLAIADFTQAIALDSSWTDAYYQRGQIYAQREQYDLALADFTQTIAQDPSHASAFYHRGEVYRSREQYDLAIADFTRAIAIWPDTAYLVYVRGESYLALGRTEEAIADFRQVHAMDNGYWHDQALQQLTALGVSP